LPNFKKIFSKYMSFILNNKKNELNNMTDKNDIEMDLTELSKSELLLKCEEYGIIKCKSKHKEELIALLKKDWRWWRRN